MEHHTIVDLYLFYLHDGASYGTLVFIQNHRDVPQQEKREFH